MTYALATRLTPQQIGPALAKLDLTSPGLAAVDGVNGNKFAVTPRTLLRVKSTNGGIVTVTADVIDTLSGLTVTDPTFTVPATTGDVIYPIGLLCAHLRAKTGYDDAFITYSDGASVTAAVYEPSS